MTLNPKAAYQHFESNITAATQLTDMYVELRKHRKLGGRGRLDAANEDLLWLPRSAVVASLSALDAYVHAVLHERIPHVLRREDIPDSLCTRMVDIIPIKNPKDFRKALPIIVARKAVAELSARLREELGTRPFQSPKNIQAAYGLIGHPDIFEDVSNIWSGPNRTAEDIRKKLAGYVKRRNQIVHEGDRDAHGNPHPMRPDYAYYCRDFTANLVTKLNGVVHGT